MADYTVAYSELNSLLQSLPNNTKQTYYSINVTGLTQANVLGSYVNSTITSSPLSVILKNRAKYVYLDLQEDSFVEEVTSLYYAFISTHYLVGISYIPNSVTNMSRCFTSCTSFNQPITIPNSVINMSSCFGSCTSFNQPITIPNSVTNMSHCFYGCSSFNQPITISNSVTNMDTCFQECSSFNQPITIPNSVTNMSYCFTSCTSFNQPITIPNSVTNMSYCFTSCTSFNQPITIPNSVTNMSRCFYGCSSFNQPITISNSVTDMGSCFTGCTKYNAVISIPITNHNLIFNSGFNGDYKYNLNITEITNAHTVGTSSTFSTFGEIINKSHRYGSYITFHETQESYINVTDMSYCFNGCSSFNQNIVLPNTAENLSYCFNGCSMFNQPLKIPSSATNMDSCFNNCTSFNQNIVLPPTITNMSSCFYGCSALEEITFQNENTEHISTLLNNSNDCFYECTLFRKINVILPTEPQRSNKWTGYHIKPNATDSTLVDISIYNKENIVRETTVLYSQDLQINGLINNIVFDVDNSTIPPQAIEDAIDNRITLSQTGSQRRYNYNGKNFVLWGSRPDALVTNMDFSSGSSQSLVPIGFIYFQLPNQTEPSELFGYGTWEDISEEYANAFFRVSGNKAQSFENQVTAQSEQVPDVGGKFTVSYSSKTPTGIYKKVTSGLLSNAYAQAGGTEYESKLSWGDSKYVEGGEVRPLNYTIKVWRRTQ